MNNPRSPDFEGRSRPIEDQLIRHLQALIPRDWQLAMFQLDVTLSPTHGTRSIRHRLWNPVTDAEIRDFPEALFQTTSDLHLVFSEYGQAWVRCLMFYRSDPAGGLQIETHYRYPF
jgi:hypothetical protein